MKIDLIEKLIQNAKFHFECNYSDKKSVHKSNIAANKINEIGIELIQSNHSEDFFNLLKVQENRIDLWVAHIILSKIEIFEIPEIIKTEAKAVARLNNPKKDDNYDKGDEHESYYMEIEYMDGPVLSSNNSPLTE